MTSSIGKARAFAAFHAQTRGFVMPNAWDAGSAAMLADAGFPAIGTTSAGIAFSLGRPDFDVRDRRLAVPREVMFDRIREIVGAVALPVNGDLEDGYGAAPDEVADTIRLAIDAGLAGANIEDHDPRAGDLYDEALAVERIRAARAAIDAAGSAFVLTARTDARPDAEGLEACVRRLALYREAGADCLFAPRFPEMAAIRVLVSEAGGPLNVVMGFGPTHRDCTPLLDAGVARISLGGSVARASLAYVRAAMRELAGQGTIDFAAGQITQRELNEIFARALA